MKTSLKLTIILLLCILFLARPSPAYAQGFSCEKFVFGGEYTLNEGETLIGDLCVFGGVASLATGSTVAGDVLLLGGTLKADGTIE